MPEFVRVCEGCGEPVVEQRLLPEFAESLAREDEPEPYVGTYGDPISEFEFEIIHSEAPLASSFELPDDPDAEPELEAAHSETVAEAEPVAVPAVAAALRETPEPVHTAGVLFGAEQEPPRRSRRREVVFAVVVLGVGGALTFGAMRGGGGAPLTATPLTAASAEKPALPAPAPTPAAAAPASAPTPAPAAAPAPEPAPTAAVASGRWNPGNAAWSGSSKRAVAFEVEANNLVSIWMRSVRPTLVVRCTGGKIEAFVYTSSAARIEPGTDDHTVRYSFDSGHETVQRWRDSEEHDALFAPDGESVARRLMDANMFRFVFNPHNAEPASAHFSVAGLRPLIEGAQRNCRVK